MDENLKIFIDYVLGIRGQGMQLYQTLLVIFIGSILAAAFVASLMGNHSGEGDGTRNTSGEHRSRHKWFIASFVLFIVFLLFLRVRHATKREFCDKWIANHLSSSQTSEILIRNFSKAHYALDCPGDKGYTVDPNDLPKIWLRDWARGTSGLLFTHLIPVFSGGCLMFGLMTHSSKKRVNKQTT